MLFNNLDKNTKIEILEENIPKHEKKIYGFLAELAINPDSFDQDSFVVNEELIDPNDSATITVRENLKKALDALQSLRNQISLLEE